MLSVSFGKTWPEYELDLVSSCAILPTGFSQHIVLFRTSLFYLTLLGLFFAEQNGMTNQYKTKYPTGNVIWALQSNALADIFCGNTPILRGEKIARSTPQCN